MTTALDIIKRSMRMLGVYSIGEEPGPDESQDGLSVLNSLMEDMANAGQLVYAKSLDSIAVPASTASITVGPSGTTITTRPVQVLEETYFTIGTVSYPLRVLTLQDYNDIGLKGITGLPAGIWPQMDMPNITLTLWPVPSEAITLKLWSDKQITSFPTLTTTVTLPPGYERLLAFLLAEDIAPEYEVNPPPAVLAGAASARRKLKRTNLQVPTLDLPQVMYHAPFRDIRQL